MSGETSDAEIARSLASVAELAVTTAVNLQPGQELIVSAPLEAHAFVRDVAHSAYRHGARGVTCVYEDPALIRAHLVEAPAEVLDYAPPWLHRGIADALRAGAARLRILGPYPDLLSAVPADRIVRAHRALAMAVEDETRLLDAAAINWSAVPVVTGAWARQVFPASTEADARARLWSVLFDVLRVREGNPQDVWQRQIQWIDARCAALQAQALTALRFAGGDTDLTVGLAPGHRWVGGTVTAANGVAGIRTLPAEEVSAALDGRTANGRIVFSRPLALGGTLVRHLAVELREGLVTAVRAESGAEVFERLLEGNGGCRLTNVGLVASSSPAARSGVLFWNPMLDRAAAAHVTFGTGPAMDTAGSGSDDNEHASSAGHRSRGALGIDGMFDTERMRVDGMTGDGRVIPVMREGVFVL